MAEFRFQYWLFNSQINCVEWQLQHWLAAFLLIWICPSTMLQHVLLASGWQDGPSSVSFLLSPKSTYTAGKDRWLPVLSKHFMSSLSSRKPLDLCYSTEISYISYCITITLTPWTTGFKLHNKSSQKPKFLTVTSVMSVKYDCNA